VNRFVFPVLGSMGNQSSLSTSGFDPDGAVAMTEATASDVVLLGGLLRFEGVTSRLTARSDGEKATVAGGTTVVGAEVAGTAVRIDSSGVHVADQGIDAVAVQQAVNQALAAAGVSVELASPVDTIEGGRATRALGGVLVRIRSSSLEPLIAALPEELQRQVRGQLTLDQEVTIQLAPAAVTAGAARNIEFPSQLPGLAAPPAGGGEVGATGGGVVGDAPAGGSGSAGGAPSPGLVPAGTTSVSMDFDGVPVWLVALLVIVAFVSSRPLTALADRLLAARAGGGCPEGRN
jgi:hypothetical protein